MHTLQRKIRRGRNIFTNIPRRTPMLIHQLLPLHLIRNRNRHIRHTNPRQTSLKNTLAVLLLPLQHHIVHTNLVRARPLPRPVQRRRRHKTPLETLISVKEHERRPARLDKITRGILLLDTVLILAYHFIVFLGVVALRDRDPGKPVPAQRRAHDAEPLLHVRDVRERGGDCAAVREEEVGVVDAGRVGAGDVEAACAADEDEVGCCGGFVGEDELADGFEEGHCVLLETRSIWTGEMDIL